MRINRTEMPIQLMYFDHNLHQKNFFLHCVYVMANKSNSQTHPSIKDPDTLI